MDSLFYCAEEKKEYKWLESLGNNGTLGSVPVVCRSVPGVFTVPFSIKKACFCISYVFNSYFLRIQFVFPTYSIRILY